MLKRILAIAVIFCCTSIAWMILASSIWSRTRETGEKLKPDVSSTWGGIQEQKQPFATYEETIPETQTVKSGSANPPEKRATGSCQTGWSGTGEMMNDAGRMTATARGDMGACSSSPTEKRGSGICVQMCDDVRP